VKRGLVLALLLAAAPVAHADGETDTLTYRVRQGDTVELVAAELYGDKTAAMFVVTENKLLEGKPQRVRPIHAGERLRVPVAREIATAKGDTFESLAQTYLGDAKRAQFLADYNSLSIEDGLAAGTVIEIPPRVTHVAPWPESLAAIATAYFGDAKQADLLKRYNFLDRTSIEKGESIVVPGLRVHSTKVVPLDADGKDRHDKQKKAIADATDALPRARSAWMVGDFAGVLAVLAEVDGELDFLDAKTAVEVALLVGKAHVAFDDTDAAVAAFAQVLDRKPRYALGAYADSPKVLAAWRKAGGHVEGE
jgi:LysM repeat protein